MSWIWITGLVTYALGILSGYLNRFVSLFWLSSRISPEKVKEIYKFLDGEKRWKFVFNETLNPSGHQRMPEDETSFIILKDNIIFLTISEKYLTAGSSAKEIICHITYLRPLRKRLEKLLEPLYSNKPDKERTKVDIYSNIYWTGYSILNEISRDWINKLILPPVQHATIDGIVNDVKTGKREKAGILLHGAPGNGKTTIIKAIAAKYNYDIYIPIVSQGMSNSDIIALFSSLPKGGAVVVLEDFDNLFDERYPVARDAKYSFDVFLNIFDGLYANLKDKVIVMTTNRIESIDCALKNRPSRFDTTLEIKNPDRDLRRKILQRFELSDVEEIVDLTDDVSMSVVCEIAQRVKTTEGTIAERVKRIIDEYTQSEYKMPSQPRVLQESPTRRIKLRSL